MQAGEFMARIGGDEFAVLLPDTDLADAISRLEALHQLLRYGATLTGSVSASIGVATFSRAPSSAHELVDAADRVMYKVKKRGKNMVWGERADAPSVPATTHLG
jgi:diguanylate cyclase (GGDEF)-like protein